MRTRMWRLGRVNIQYKIKNRETEKGKGFGLTSVKQTGSRTPKPGAAKDLYSSSKPTKIEEKKSILKTKCM